MGKSTTRKGTFDTYITFATPGYENAQYTSPIVRGKYFTDNDIANSNPVCVIDEIAALYLFGNTNVIGMSFELAVDSGIQEVTIVGIRETSADIMEVCLLYTSSPGAPSHSLPAGSPWAPGGCPALPPVYSPVLHRKSASKG